MRKAIKTVISILKSALPLIVLILAVVIIFNINQKKQQQKQIDELFVSGLVNARSTLGNDLTQLKEADRTYTYTTMASNLYTSVNLLDFTTYNHNEDRNVLFSAIYNLYLCMTNAGYRYEIFTIDQERVHQDLDRIIRDPNDKQACEDLDKLAGDLFFGR